MMRCSRCNKKMFSLFGAKGQEGGICRACRKKEEREAADRCAQLTSQVQQIQRSSASPQIKLQQLQAAAEELETLAEQVDVRSYSESYMKLKANLQQQIDRARQRSLMVASPEQTGSGEDFASRLKRELLLAERRADEQEILRRPVAPQPTDKTFEVFYVRPTLGELRPAQVVFEEAELEHIRMDGIRRRFAAEHVRELGFSDDGKYKGIANDDLVFWVRPPDYREFLGNVRYHEQKLAEYKKQQWLAEKARIEAPLTLDQPDQRLYSCFLAGPPKGAGPAFDKLREALAALCAEKDGRYYKTPAKSAQACVLFAPELYTAEAAEEYRAKGYAVFGFSEALRFLELERLWDLTAYGEQVTQFRNSHQMEYEEYLSQQEEANPPQPLPKLPQPSGVEAPPPEAAPSLPPEELAKAAAQVRDVADFSSPQDSQDGGTSDEEN